MDDVMEVFRALEAMLHPAPKRRERAWSLDVKQ